MNLRLPDFPKDEFPKLPEFKDKEAIKIRQPLLKEMFIKTGFAASKDETRYVLNGILFEVENNKSQPDSHRWKKIGNYRKKH